MFTNLAIVWGPHIVAHFPIRSCEAKHHRALQALTCVAALFSALAAIVVSSPALAPMARSLEVPSSLAKKIRFENANKYFMRKKQILYNI